MGLTRQTAIGSGVKLFVRRYRLQSGNLINAPISAGCTRTTQCEEGLKNFSLKKIKHKLQAASRTTYSCIVFSYIPYANPNHLPSVSYNPISVKKFIYTYTQKSS